MGLDRLLENTRSNLRQLEEDAALHAALYDRAQVWASSPVHPLRVQAQEWLPTLRQGIHAWGDAIARAEREIAELEDQAKQVRRA